MSSKDCVVRLKGDPNAPASPSVPGFHIVGEISALGSKVSSTAFRKGDRIAALLPNGGGNAKYVSIPVSSAILLPKNSNHQDTICLVANYMTAYQCLKLAKKDGLPLTNANVLITGGSGPVGQALVELALREGAKVYATAHKMHEEHLTKLGAKWFSVKPKKWIGYLEGKMDVVIDSLCVDGYESSYRALTPDGILVCNTGNISSLQLQNDPSNNGQGVCNSVFEDNGINTWWSTVKAKYFWNRAIFYDLNESYEENPKMFGHELHYLIIKLQRGEISPKVAGKVSLNQVPKAQKLIEKVSVSVFNWSVHNMNAQVRLYNTCNSLQSLYLMFRTFMSRDCPMVQWYACLGRSWTPSKKSRLRKYQSNVCMCEITTCDLVHNCY